MATSTAQKSTSVARKSASAAQKSASAAHKGMTAPPSTAYKIVDIPEVQEQIHKEGGDPLTSTAAEYGVDIDKEESKWGGLVKKLGLKVE